MSEVRPAQDTPKRRFPWPALLFSTLFATIFGLLAVFGGTVAALEYARTKYGPRPDVDHSSLVRLREQVVLLRPIRGFRTTPSDRLSPSEAARVLDETPAGKDFRARWTEPKPTQAMLTGSSTILTDPASDASYFRPSDVMAAALSGLSEAEMAYLRGFGGDPRFPAYSTVAAAAGIDWMGRRGLEPGTLIHTIPILRFGWHREVTYNRIAYAAYLAADGRLEEAEQLLREVISVGFVLVDDGTRHIDALIGVLYIRRASTPLRDLYLAMGLIEDARLLSDFLASLEQVNERYSNDRLAGLPILGSESADSRGSGLLGLAADTALPGSLRWAALAEAVRESACGSLGAIASAPNESFRASVEALRPSLVRYPSQELLFDAMVNSVDLAHAAIGDPDAFDPPLTTGVFPVLSVVRTAGAILGNPRIDACYALRQRAY